MSEATAPSAASAAPEPTAPTSGKRFRFSLFSSNSKKSSQSYIKALKTLFEQVYSTHCGSYFEVEAAAAPAADAAAESEFKVLDVKHGAGAGYSGEAKETALTGMKAKHQKRMAKDKEFASLFKDLGGCDDLTADSNVNFIIACMLREASFAEMTEQRQKMFMAMLQLLKVFRAKAECSRMLEPSNPHGNVLELLRRKKEEAATYIKLDQDGDAVKLSKAIDQVLEASSEENNAPAPAADEVKDGDVAASGSEASVDDIRSWLSSKKLSFASGIAASSTLLKFDKGDAIKKPKLQRMKKEISILANSLPDGIFVKVDDERMDFMQVMIVGPQGTPYENGCFMFDLYLPADFPTKCPKMNFLTTGGGGFRFNPNLYQDGKVCLSLLGTWQGPGWNSETSTLLQLLVSLQALVFVDYPLENEPGHEGQALQAESLAYNKNIRHATVLYAMIWHFSNPNPSIHFTNEAKLYLFANKEVISKQFEGWTEKNSQSTAYCSYFSSSVSQSFQDMEVDLMAFLRSFPEGVKLE